MGLPTLFLKLWKGIPSISLTYFMRVQLQCTLSPCHGYLGLEYIMNDWVNRTRNRLRSGIGISVATDLLSQVQPPKSKMKEPPSI